VNLRSPAWRTEIDSLAAASHVSITSYGAYIHALEDRRRVFKELGATATDHAAETPYSEALSPEEADLIFTRALRGESNDADAARFGGHMLIEMARMSAEDGLVMQLHVGSYRNHNPLISERFGPDKGADIPLATEWTCNLKPLLDRFGTDRRLTLVLFTLDEATYSRELAPLAGHYPALRLGPPWWFFDSYHGMRRYFDQVVETAGLHNTAGFNDDTRAFPSIPARHDLWRRVAADWIAGLLVRGLIDDDDAQEMILDCAYRLAKQVYKLP
jgi:glucuronate isomerase